MMKRSISNTLRATTLIISAGLLLGACVGAEPEDPSGPEVVWDEAAGKCYVDGTEATFQGESSEAACEALAGASEDGALSSFPGTTPQLKPRICCYEVMNCTPSGCTSGGIVCEPC